MQGLAFAGNPPLPLSPPPHTLTHAMICNDVIVYCRSGIFPLPPPPPPPPPTHTLTLMQ